MGMFLKFNSLFPSFTCTISLYHTMTVKAFYSISTNSTVMSRHKRLWLLREVADKYATRNRPCRLQLEGAAVSSPGPLS